MWQPFIVFHWQVFCFTTLNKNIHNFQLSLQGLPACWIYSEHCLSVHNFLQIHIFSVLVTSNLSLQGQFLRWGLMSLEWGTTSKIFWKSNKTVLILILYSPTHLPPSVDSGAVPLFLNADLALSWYNITICISALFSSQAWAVQMSGFPNL